jgi:guanylate kinase
MNQGKAIIISAPSGSGKTSIVHRLMQFPELNLRFSVSATTRGKRQGETDGKDYHFLTKEEFSRKINNNEFIEWEEVYPGTFYGTLKSDVENLFRQGYNVIFDVDVKGGLSLKKYFGDKALSIFIKVPSIELLEQRLRQRKTETEEKLKERIAKAKWEMTFENRFDVTIVNDDLHRATKEAYEVIKKFLQA